MKVNTRLNKLKKSLPKHFCYFKDSNILVISEDKSILPFCFVIVDPEFPNHFLVSLAVDYPNSIQAAEIIVKASALSNIALTEPFYISVNSGKTYMDDEAYSQWDLDTIDLNSLAPLSPSVN
jgi:hypothetical protein